MRATRGHFLSAAVAAVAGPPLAAPAQTPAHLVIGTTPIDAAMGVFAAQRAGIFRKYGLDVDLESAGVGASNAAALVGGSLQISGSNVATTIKAHLRGVPYLIIAPGPLSVNDHATNLLVVSKDGPIKTAADLNGKTVASSAIGDLSSTAALAWIEAHGGNAGTVKVVELRPSSMLALLQAGRIDAATIGEPYLSDAMRSGSVRSLGRFYDVIGPRFLDSAYIAMPAFIDANPELIKRYVRAQLDGNAFANDHPDQTAPWLADIAKMDLAEVKQTQRVQFAETMDPQLVQVVIDALVRLKQIDRGFDAREIISPLTLGMRRGT